jgi:hypothetical protein
MDNGMWSRWRRHLTRILLAVTVSMSTGEFIEVQKLSHEDLRTRFKLPASCDPSVTALNTDPAGNQMTVAIECRVRLAPAPPGERREPRPAGKGS